VIALHVGTEKAVAATKTYTGSLVALALLSCGLQDDCDMLDEIKRLPGLMDETLQGLLPLTNRMERYRYMEHCAVIGRGYNYSTAFEISLKVKELTGIAVEPYSSADFLHGPIATVHRSFPVLVVAHRGMVFSDMVEIIHKVKERGAELLTLSDAKEVNAMAQFPMPIPDGIPEWLSPVVDVLPGQLLGWQLAVQKGLDPDNPIGLSKVTETV
jgi:glucosamine--fructose-6-phosphate aminotransferase (isomerizing)